MRLPTYSNFWNLDVVDPHFLKSLGGARAHGRKCIDTMDGKNPYFLHRHVINP